jgi:hypothetical protein
MLIAAHTAAGVIIATQTTTPLLAFIVGVVFHFVLDFIPHGDNKIIELFNKRIHRDRILSMNILDTFITIFYLMYIYTYTTIPHTTFLFWAIFGSILPDFLNIFGKVFMVRFLDPYVRFHSYIHDYIPSRMTIKQGLVFQVVFIVFLIYITI